MIENFIYPHRNGEMTLPELSEREFSHYWFDGIAHYENWRGAGEMIVVTGGGTDRVIGLVVVAMMIDIKRPLKAPDGSYIHNRATMIAEPETTGYDLDRCVGRWWGPVHVPRLSDDMFPSMAAVEDYELWKQFYDGTKMHWEEA